MLKTIIKKNTYQDSVVLMLLTNEISSLEGVNKVSIMMGTPANKDILEGSGLRTSELEEASSNDMAIVIDTENDSLINTVLSKVDEFLYSQSKSSSSKSQKSARTWDTALKKLPEANLAVISLPGIYAVAEANRALDENLNVFLFSDNVSIEDEVSLKEKAKSMGLLLMGPDCGTGIINSVPIAFTNNIKPGKIGIVGASGTGIQEVTTIIDKLGEGVSNAIGTGGRDLYEKVGAITMLSAIATLVEDVDTKVITVISKPPAKLIRDKVLNYLRTIDKPVVTIFLGEKPEYHEDNLYHAYTLEETARISVALARGEEVKQYKGNPSNLQIENIKDGLTIKAYYSGGTLAGEAAMLIRDGMNMDNKMINEKGYMLKKDGFEIVDLGDDEYTQGKPHPMIDPTKRIECMEKAMEDKTTSVILFDIVLGFGSHENMAGALAPSIEKLKAQALEEDRDITFITTICGTKQDPQGYDEQKSIMINSGVKVCDSNDAAVQTALSLIGKKINYTNKEVVPREAIIENCEVNVSKYMKALITTTPKIINVGLKSFSNTLEDFPCEVIQLDWKPRAGGNVKLARALDFLRNFEF